MIVVQEWCDDCQCFHYNRQKWIGKWTEKTGRHWPTRSAISDSPTISRSGRREGGLISGMVGNGS
jgi:hypothetical protein